MLHKTFGIIKENSSRLPADKDSDFWINYPCTCQRAFHLTLAIISIANDNFHKQKLVPRKTNVNQKVASRTLYWLQCLLCAVKFQCILFRILFSFVSYFKTAFSVEIEIKAEIKQHHCSWFEMKVFGNGVFFQMWPKSYFIQWF